MKKFKLFRHDSEYYRIYEKRRETPLEEIPSFKWMRDTLALKEGERFLDAGCGEGGLVRFLCVSSGAKGTGVDSSEAALALARAQKASCACEFIGADLCALPFKDGEFDKIACFNVIEHIVDQQKAMRELLRVLKPGGVAVFGTNIKDSLSWRIYQLVIGEHTHTHEFYYGEFVAFVARFFSVGAHARTSGVFRAPRPLRWIFHNVLKGDVMVRAAKPAA
ncbi:MAG: hypothetical protein A2583_06000 [Bdellovibrionales bacterium RIFOXYD1_FULL_53_11]|nr:MAG: hypothetical protein A2583_06000 [Bdellovibrionales bacterium RIFOXYD1_FULL_53_11]